MVARRPRQAGLVIAALALFLGCGGSEQETAGDAAQPSTAECPELDDAQIAEFVRLQTEGIEHYRNRRTEQAIEVLDKARELNPCDPSVYNDLGIAYHQNHEIKRAVATLEQGIELDPMYPNSHLNLGAVYDDFANFDKAAEEYARFIELNPDFPDAYSRLGLVYMKLNQFDQARVQLDRAAELKPTDWEVWYNLGNIAFREKDFTLAEKHYRKTLEVNRNYTEAHYKLGQTLTRLGREDEAKEFYDEFRELSQYQEKIDELNRLLRQNSDRADAVHMMLGYQYSSMGRLEEAVEDFNKSLEMRPENPEALVGLSHALRRLKKFDEAMQAAQKALELQPNMLRALDAVSSIYHDQGRQADALKVIKAMRAAHPQYDESLLNLGIIHKGLKEYRDALVNIDEYLGKKPDSLRAHEVALGIYTYAEDERFLNGAKALEHARECERLGSEKYDLVAEAYHMNGQLDLAIEWLERGIAAVEDEDEVASLKRHLEKVQEDQRTRL